MYVCTTKRSGAIYYFIILLLLLYYYIIDIIPGVCLWLYIVWIWNINIFFPQNDFIFQIKVSNIFNFLS